MYLSFRSFSGSASSSRLSPLLILVHRGVDDPEPGVPIGVFGSFQCFAVALQTVAQVVQELGYQGVADGASGFHRPQFCGESARALAYSAER